MSPAREKVYFKKLAARCEAIESSLCIGLDPDPRRIPESLGTGPEGVYRFCTEIVDATADHAAAFKPNLAFFEAIGVEGWHVLSQVLEKIPRDIPIIIDGKRGDIGSTAQLYARSIFERLKADATTINPLMGYDSVEPFLKYQNQGVYVLCLTSNKGARDFQRPHDLYLRVAEAANTWNEHGNVGLVVGGTKPRQLAAVRKMAPGLPLLIPGLGAQGGDLDKIMASWHDDPRHHLLINVSRSILFASKGTDFGRAARKTALYYRNMINQARDKAAHAHA